MPSREYCDRMRNRLLPLPKTTHQPAHFKNHSSRRQTILQNGRLFAAILWRGVKRNGNVSDTVTLFTIVLNFSG